MYNKNFFEVEKHREANLIFLTNVFITRTKLLLKKKKEACYTDCSKSVFLSMYELLLFIHSWIGSFSQSFIREHRSSQNRSHLQSSRQNYPEQFQLKVFSSFTNVSFLYRAVRDEKYCCPSCIVPYRRRFRFRFSFESEEEPPCDSQFDLVNFWICSQTFRTSLSLSVSATPAVSSSLSPYSYRDVKLGGNKAITLYVTNRSTDKIDAKSYLSSSFVDHVFVDASSSRPRITFSCSFG